LTVQYIASNGKFTVKNCNNIFGINENDYTVDYIDCSNVGASKEYVDEAVANLDVDLTGYATEEYVRNSIPAVPTKVSAFSNDAKYVTEDYVTQNTPTNVSQLNNDANYATQTYVSDEIKKIEIPSIIISDDGEGNVFINVISQMAEGGSY
jgi:hypothetical protein